MSVFLTTSNSVVRRCFSPTGTQGEPASVRHFLPHQDHPGKIFDLELPLADVVEGYCAVNEPRHQGVAPGVRLAASMVQRSIPSERACVNKLVDGLVLSDRNWSQITSLLQTTHGEKHRTLSIARRDGEGKKWAMSSRHAEFRNEAQAALIVRNLTICRLPGAPGMEWKHDCRP